MNDAEKLAHRLTEAVPAGFSGVVRVDDPATGFVAQQAYGFADRAYEIPVTFGTRFGVASITKGFTALVIGSLLDEGQLTLDTRARSVLGDDLPLIDNAVTIEQLLSHTSGIGDYLDEAESGDFNDYVMPFTTHLFTSTSAYLPALDGRPQVFEPGTKFAYNNSGFVILALIAERIAGLSFAELVAERVFKPARMLKSGFPRMDELPGDVARGYLFNDGLRSNVLHLPVQGSGDGGLVTNAEDLSRFWQALITGQIVTSKTLDLLLDRNPNAESDGMVYAKGFWRGKNNDDIILEGADAGCSARTWVIPSSGIITTILSNTTDGAWNLLNAVNWSD